MTDLRIELLGGFRVAVGARGVPDDAWRQRKPAALLKLLALAPGHRLHREQVMDRLWPDLDPSAAAANLRKAPEPSANYFQARTYRLFPSHVRRRRRRATMAFRSASSP